MIETLWPELDGDAAANNLRVAVSRARRVLEANDAEPGRFLTRIGAMYALAAPGEAWVDVDLFDTALRRAWASDNPENARDALDAYGGDLLPDDLYDEWAMGRRLALRASHLALLARLGRMHEERGEPRQAIAAWRQLLLADPLDEPAHAALIALYARVGETRQAIVQFERLAAVLATELGAEPEKATRDLAAAIRSGRFPPATESDASAHKSPEIHTRELPAPAAASVRLPAPPDELVGRERELHELVRLISARRLVTLTGPAGVGKTRLALAAATAAADTLPAAAVWTDLAALPDSTLVLPAIARSLGVVESGDASLDAAVDARIGDEPFLLVIDNFEQVMPAAPALAAMLAACPALRLIVTSRGPLRVRGEQEYPVLPLAVPASGDSAADSAAAAQSRRYGAVDLFARRVQAARPDVAFSAEDMAVITEICRRLDGLPLAIELAAARARVLPLPALRQSIERPLAILTDSPRDAPERQRTLRTAIAWSHDLLDAPARSVFMQLAVFSGSIALDSVAAIASGTGKARDKLTDPNAEGVLGVLTDLFDQGFLQRRSVSDDTPRFSMLLTIRDFAEEQLGASGDVSATKRRHADWFLALAERAEPGLVGPDAATWLDRLEADHDNLRAALESMLGRGEHERALRLAAALWRFWWLRGYLSEGRWRLDRALADGTHASAELRAKALDAAGGLASAQGDLERAAALHTAALEQWRATGDRDGMASALTNLGLVADERGDPVQAERFLREALDLARAAGNRRGVAVALANLGQVAMSRQDHGGAAVFLADSARLFAALGDLPSRAAILANLGALAFFSGDYERAEMWHASALASMRALSDRQGEADELLNLGHTVQQRGDLSRARGLFADALDAFRGLGDRGGEAFALNHLGRLAHLEGDAAAAERSLRAGFAIGAEIGDRVAEVEAMEGLAMLACAQGDAVRCARLLGASSGVRERIGVPLPPLYRQAVDERLAEARRALGAATFETVLAEGRASAVDRLDNRSAPAIAALAG